ncbi:hypothetical protein AKJ41_01725 [candidate division MSBL1 archaeon SCGC-AAA259O05]|uniref:Uncharacterized protein n=1 Tax=candidate division MSBL1 archaeon SCGC-AAA259O05 TaxID=1698271 RepID=A0A133V4L3_9EURY|nr:hypothetical protein AKJ41_01725 [candidate division MSBL1 archaeon SCGC-AAA259O05]
MDWPSYGVSYTRKGGRNKNKYFRIEGEAKTHYVDFPNQLTQNFFSELLGRISQKHPNKPEKQYEKALEVKQEYNEKLQEHGYDFLTYVVVKGKTGEKPTFGIQVRIYEDKFKNFLEEFSQTTDLNLSEKYRYLMLSRFSTLVIESKSERTSKSGIEDLQNEIKELVEEDLEVIDQKLDNIISKVKKWQVELQKYWSNRSLWKYFNTYPSTLLYLMEMESILENIKILIQRGAITPSYREMRKLLENLSWSIFDDFLFINSKYYRFQTENPKKNLPEPRSFLNFHTASFVC